MAIFYFVTLNSIPCSFSHLPLFYQRLFLRLGPLSCLSLFDLKFSSRIKIANLLPLNMLYKTYWCPHLRCGFHLKMTISQHTEVLLLFFNFPQFLLFARYFVFNLKWIVSGNQSVNIISINKLFFFVLLLLFILIVLFVAVYTSLFMIQIY